MTEFTPFSAALGGALIGLASALLLWLNGRIAGISGILGGLLSRRPGDMIWRIAFVLGLIAAPAAIFGLTGPVTATIEANTEVLVIAGLLVGIGTRYGAGCTSGHGVCGLSRLSPRSLVATLAFMGAGMVIVFVMRHLLS